MNAVDEKALRDVLFRLRSGQSDPVELKIVANELEEKWFPDSRSKQRDTLIRNANWAYYLRSIVRAYVRHLKASAPSQPAGWYRKTAHELVARDQGIRVETLLSRLEAGKKAATQLGIRIDLREKQEAKVWAEMEEYDTRFRARFSKDGKLRGRNRW